MKITKGQIKKARIALGLSQEEFGFRLGMSGSNVSMLERGLNSPIDVDEDERMYEPWQAMLAGDVTRVADLPNRTAAWLRKTRLKKNLSLEELSQKSNVDERHIRSIEHGALPGNATVVRKLETALGEVAPAETSPSGVTNAIPGVGKLEDFNPHNVDERPVCAGIYVLYDISDRPIYIGESKNIRQRLKQHEEKFWFKSPLVEYAAYVQIDDSTLRAGIEQILINFLRSNAVLNKQHVSRE